MSFNYSSPRLESPLPRACKWDFLMRVAPWARNLGNLERHVASASSRGEQPKIWNLGSGTWNLGPGTQREAEQQCSRRSGRVPYAEQLQSNLTSTLRRCIPLAIRLISDSTTT
ncbi:hypothetical protein DY000_02040745 [Brassica cretica]|uniref:Uncharacterized protein n=1 Tax=Brassica cretica TaxID=69181 RepID=A0ABQ7BG54_BRACR|nr:hypothetical protein DY000_02040745 [Brassica cretica]